MDILHDTFSHKEFYPLQTYSDSTYFTLPSHKKVVILHYFMLRHITLVLKLIHVRNTAHIYHITIKQEILQ